MAEELEHTRLANMDVDSDQCHPCRCNPSVSHSEKFTLENASSAADLLVAVRDVISTLQHLVLKEDILHKHIGYNNILIQNGGNDSVKGLVIDLDFPNPAEGSSRDPVGFNSCSSFVFQSVNRLLGHGESTRQFRAKDDFESVFYVLCWACYGYDHTGRPDRFRPAWMAEWTAQRYPETFAQIKSTFRGREIPLHVNRYMGCHRDIIEGVIEELRKKIVTYKGDGRDDYDDILKILEKGIAKANAEPCGTMWECLKVERSAAAKRKFCNLESENLSNSKKRKGPIAAIEDAMEE
ncbi:hypothetical protein C8R44DRAFT_825216 [Mycena epipterygia]|nr:hypothetical protein C8R44DRAFT_825216 [Mycena epipterygia]